MTDEKNINDMMFCEECGTKIKKGVKFCENCGIQIKYIKDRPFFLSQDTSVSEERIMSKEQTTIPQLQQVQQETMYNNPFGDTYVTKPLNVNLIKMIIIAVFTSILVLMWVCAPVIRIEYANGISSTIDYFSSSEFSKDLSIGKILDIAMNMMDYENTLPDELQTDLQTASVIMVLMFMVIFVLVIFAGIFIYSLIKLDSEAVKEDMPRVTMCTVIIFFFLFCLVMTFNDFVENDYIDIIRFEFGAGSYIVIALTIVIQCISSSIIVKKEDSKQNFIKQDIQREYWVCPTCGTNNPGNEFCYKCGFENRVVTIKNSK